MPTGIPGKVPVKTRQAPIYQQVDSLAEIILQYDWAPNLLHVKQKFYISHTGKKSIRMYGCPTGCRQENTGRKYAKINACP